MYSMHRNNKNIGLIFDKKHLIEIYRITTERNKFYFLCINFIIYHNYLDLCLQNKQIDRFVLINF